MKTPASYFTMKGLLRICDGSDKNYNEWKKSHRKNYMEKNYTHQLNQET